MERSPDQVCYCTPTSVGQLAEARQRALVYESKAELVTSWRTNGDLPLDDLDAYLLFEAESVNADSDVRLQAIALLRFLLSRVGAIPLAASVRPLVSDPDEKVAGSAFALMSEFKLGS